MRTRFFNKRTRVLLAVLVALALAGAALLFCSDVAEQPTAHRKAIEAQAAESQALSDREIIRRFHKLFYEARPWDGSSWLGAPIKQHPCDMWIMQEIIYRTTPDFIIETGTLHGGSALFFASVLQQVNPDGKVITVDIDLPPDSFLEGELTKKAIVFIQGDSVSEEVIGKIKRRIQGSSKVHVLLDSDHSKEHVLKELELYSQFVSPGGYIMVHDTNMGGNPVRPEAAPGPLGAVREFLESNDDFVVDESKERYLVTFSPSGFLRRVR